MHLCRSLPRTPQQSPLPPTPKRRSLLLPRRSRLLPPRQHRRPTLPPRSLVALAPATTPSRVRRVCRVRAVLVPVVRVRATTPSLPPRACLAPAVAPVRIVLAAKVARVPAVLGRAAHRVPVAHPVREAHPVRVAHRVRVAPAALQRAAANPALPHAPVIVRPVRACRRLE